MKKRVVSIILVLSMMAVLLSSFSGQLEAKASSDDVTMDYDVYLAEYFLNSFPYEYSVNQFKLPYRSVIEQNQNSTAYQSLYLAWYTATFQVSDLIKLSQKKYTLNEAMLYDILFRDCDDSDYYKNLESDVQDTQAALIKDIFIELYNSSLDKTTKEFKEIEAAFLKADGTSVFSDVTAGWLKDCETLKKIASAVGITADAMEIIFTGFSTAEDIVNCLAKIKVISCRVNEDLKSVLLDLAGSDVPDLNLASALNNLIEAYDSRENLDMIIAGVIAGKSLSAIVGTVLDKFASRLLDICLGAGFLISGAQQLGKTISSKLIYSTEEEFEMYDKMTTLYTFEDHLKSKIRTYAYNYKNDKSVKNAKKFNASIDLLMNTYLTGMDYALDYFEITYNSGAFNRFLHSFKKGEYEKHKKSLESIRDSFEFEISFYRNNVRNSYINSIKNYYSDHLDKNADDYVEMTKTEELCTETEIAQCLKLIDDMCFEYNNLSINKEFKLTRDMHTYGSMKILSEGYLDLNGHKLTVDGDCNVNGGSIDFNGGTLTVGGNMTMSGYYELNMLTYGDTLTVKGDLTTSDNNKLHGNPSGTFNLYGNWTNNDGEYYQSTTVKLLGTQNVTINGKGAIDIPSMYIEKSYTRTVSMKGIISVGKLMGGNINITAVDKPTLQFDSVQNGLYVKGKANLSVNNGVLSSIAIATLPTKTNYNANEVFDSEGLVLKAVYADGSVKKITSDYVCTPSGKLTVGGQQKITVTYAGKQTSFNVTVNGAFSITTQPVNKTINLGNSLTLSVKAEGSGFTYQWYYKKSGQSSFSTWNGRTHASETCTPNATWDGIQLYCIVKDSANNSVKSNTITVTVKSEPVITKQPTNQTINLGSSVTLSLTATGNGLTYQWYYKKTGQISFSTWNGRTHASETVTPNATWNGIQLYCIVKDSGGNSVKSNTVTVTVKSGPVITKQPTNQTISLGSSVTLSLTATGNGLTYQWYYKKSGQTSFSTWNGRTHASETCTPNDTWNGIQLYCIVKDSAGNKVQSNTVTVKVNSAGITITQQPQNQSIIAGKELTLSVKATGNSLKYQWYYKKKGQTSFNVWNGRTYATETVSPNNTWDDIQLYCKITDGSGKTINSSTVTISVLSITTQPSNVTVAEGSNATFKVVATGSGLKYQWQYKKSGQTSWNNWGARTTASTTATSNATWQGMQVRCIVTDSAGNKVTSNAATITIK